MLQYDAPDAQQLNSLTTSLQTNVTVVDMLPEISLLLSRLNSSPAELELTEGSFASEKPFTFTAAPRAVLITEDQSQTDLVSETSRLIGSEAIDVPIADYIDRPSDYSALIEDGIKVDEQEIVLAAPSQPIIAIEEPKEKNVEAVAKAEITETLTVEGTVTSLLTAQERARRAAINKKFNIRVLDLSIFNIDPLNYEAKASTSALSPQATLIASEALLSTVGTATVDGGDEYAPMAHSPTRFVVKFKGDWPNGLEACAQKIHTKGLEFKDYLSDGSSSIDQLNKICRVQKVKSLFMKRGQLTTTEAQTMQSDKMNQIKERFKDRTLRNEYEAPMPDLVNTYVFEVPEGSDINKIVELYNDDPHVEFAQPDYVMVPNVFPVTDHNDPLYSQLKWDLNNTGQTGGLVGADISANQSWLLELGGGMIIAVVDTGIDYNHIDLASNIWINPDEDLNSNGVVDGSNQCPTVNGDFNCVDDGGNGQIDDIRGYDFGDDDNDPIFFFDGSNTEWHGTFVAGMISAITDNGILISSIAPNAKIMIAKGFADVDFTTTTSLASAIVYAAMNGADVINNSWGCVDPCPSNPVAEAAVSTAYGLGAVVVFAAGNDALDVANFSPQNMKPEVITVAATNHEDERAFFSNIGALLDVSAPGDDVYSIYPFNQVAVSLGTSFSAPLVSGVAALVLAEHPTMTNAQVRWILRDSSDDIDVAGFDNNTGAGRINAYESLTLSKVLPVLIPIGEKTVLLGDIITIDVTAFDPTGNVLVLEAELLGGAALSTIGASFIDNGDGTGEFSWFPTALQVGLNPFIVFTVTDSPGGFSDSETIKINVLAGPIHICGNGIIEFPPEVCDDGNLTDGDGCSQFCQLETCGNEIRDSAEQCDNDPGPVSGDGCSALCVVEFCGDGIINNSPAIPPEECDDGIQTLTCSAACLLIICGNSRVDPGEECDEGGDTVDCDINCNWKDTSCGNGRVDIGEECDDDNNLSGDGCDSLCVDEFCGDGIVNDTNEDCDPSSVIPPSSFDDDQCSAICKNQFCGNGVVDTVLGEECDDDNALSGDGCSSSCFLEALAVCGNGTCEAERFETCANCFNDCGYCRGLRPR